jgi:hypothetical protein
MEIQLAILLAFTSLTLIFNSVVIWFAYKAFVKASTAVTETIRDIETSKNAQAWLKALEVASSHAASVSNSVKEDLAHIDPMLARAHARYEFKLAEIDVQLEKAFSTVLQQTEKLERALVQPAHRIGATFSGIREVAQLFSGEPERPRSADDATSTPTI